MASRAVALSQTAPLQGWKRSKRLAGLSRGLAAAADGTEPAEETVHIFSLASGQLYERLLKVMMQSVRKTTTAPLKFWLLADHASPAFRAAAPGLGAALGFEVEFVTYSWPPFVRRQSEKQRILWAYKILFLDVLFPVELQVREGGTAFPCPSALPFLGLLRCLSLPFCAAFPCPSALPFCKKLTPLLAVLQRIIFLDADLTIWADIRELWTADLHGAPYGYTPFCTKESGWRNEDTAGYRFWESGYWKDTLGDRRRYHISALYVVDLARLRSTGGADKLRATYNGLSADPNSLSNLDQDLPNYAQTQDGMRIHSLPQSWLWCESWCGNGTSIKQQAKAIDLCNHPVTKEHKLEMARRI